MKYLAPSVLSADFSRLGEEVRTVADAGAAYIHLDIMDGMFVPNITFGAPVIKCVRSYTDAIFDVHMMVEEPGRYVEDFAKAGADLITIHVEACKHLDRELHHIKELGCKAGVVLNPATPVSTIEHVLSLCDVVCLMSVNPGFGNQSFIPYTLQKIRQLKDMIQEQNVNTLIEIDGGVKIDNCQMILDAGADILVAGSAVYKNDRAANCKAFLDILNKYE